MERKDNNNKARIKNHNKILQLETEAKELTKILINKVNKKSQVSS